MEVAIKESYGRVRQALRKQKHSQCENEKDEQGGEESSLDTREFPYPEWSYSALMVLTGVDPNIPMFRAVRALGES